MVTGVETAGLVLGSLPLVVSALEHYAEGVNTIGKWWRYKKELLGLVRVLDAENARFLNTCEILLGGLVSASEVDNLIQHPGGPEWQDNELDRRLCQRLHRSYTPYLQSVGDMEDALRELKGKLGISGDPSKQLGWESLPTIKREFKRAKFTLLRQQYEELIQRIEKNNDTLDSLTTQSLKLEPTRQRQRRYVSRFKAIQEHARNLYHLINANLTCGCGMPHNAQLRLDSRLSDLSDMENIHNMKSLNVHFKVIFGTEAADLNISNMLQWSWQETEIRPLTLRQEENPVLNMTQTRDPLPSKKPSIVSDPASPESKPWPSIFNQGRSSQKVVSFGPLPIRPKEVSPPPYYAQESPSHLQRIESLCSAMQQCMNQAMNEQNCLGYLSNDKWQRLGVYLSQKQVRAATSSQQHRITSLAQLLSVQNTDYSQLLAKSSLLRLSRGDRLGLALTVASSVLQLHKTSWLHENFSIADILIDVEETSGKIYEQAYVRQAFPASITKKETPKLFLPVVRNETLFALGIVLIELCLGQTIDMLRSPQDPLDAEGNANSVTDFCTAKRLMEGAVYREGGTRYGDVVRRCIFCDFDQRQTDMDNETFRQAVYDGVIAPLEDDLRGFE